MSFIEGVVIIVLLFCITMIALLMISKSNYQGRIIVEIDEQNEAVKYTLEFDGDPYEISNLKDVTFKVVRKKETAD
jgi:hypothetical protein